MFIKNVLILAIVAALPFLAHADSEKNLIDKITSLQPTELRASTPACPLIIAGTQCPPANYFIRYSCCGQLNTECCFYFQDWVLLIFVILGAAIIFSAIIKILQACCGTRRSRY